MRSAKGIGRIVGALLLVQLIAGLIVPYVFLLPLTTPSAGFLPIAATMAGIVRLNVLLLLVGALASLTIAITVWPLVRDRAQRLGLWLLALAVINVTMQLVESVYWMSMLTVSKAFGASTAANADAFEVVGIAVRETFKWVHYSHIAAVVAWCFTLYWLFSRACLAPRALAAIGMLAAAVHFAGIVLPTFAGVAIPMSEFLGMPLGISHLALASWLIAKGFAGPFDSSSTDAPPFPGTESRTGFSS